MVAPAARPVPGPQSGDHPDPAGLFDIYAVKMVGDGKSYYYSYVRILNDLDLIDWLH